MVSFVLVSGEEWDSIDEELFASFWNPEPFYPDDYDEEIVYDIWHFDKVGDHIPSDFKFRRPGGGKLKSVSHGIYQYIPRQGRGYWLDEECIEHVRGLHAISEDGRRAFPTPQHYYDTLENPPVDD